MSGKKPHFYLRPIVDDLNQTAPQIHRVNTSAGSEGMSRRQFIGEGIALSALLSAIECTPAMAAPRITHATIFAHFGYVYGLTTSGDGKTLVSASEDGTVKLWDLPGGKLRSAYDDYKSPVFAACLSADGRSLLSGHQDKIARLRSLNKSDEMPEEFQCVTPVVAVRFTADGSRFATSGTDKSLTFWDRETKRVLDRFTKTDEIISALDAWNVPANLQMILRDNAAKITAFHLTPDARKLAYAAAKRIAIWNLPAGDLIKQIEQPKRDLRLMVVASKAPILAYLMSNNAIGILNYDTSDKPIVIQSPSKWITSMAIVPDGSILATGHSDGVITLWSAENGDQLGYCFDPKSNWQDGKSFEFLDQVNLVYTLPCGSAIPRGARCTCNCVSGTAREFFIAIREKQILDLQLQQQLQRWAAQEQFRQDQMRRTGPTTTTTTRWVCTCDLVYY